jgi:hypothetical protein
LLQPEDGWVALEKSIVNYEHMIASRRHSAWKIPFHTIKAALRRQIVKHLVGR